MSTKILLDTDIGTDVDDAVCLAYLLAQPACELLGITTVTGEADKRAMLASALCKVAGKDVPIYPGVAEPFLISQKQPIAQQAVALDMWPHETAFPQGQAIEFLRQTIQTHPGEVTLLTIGPLTNIALLFKTHPEIPSLLKGLVMMAGVFTHRLAGVGPLEWNAKLDPHATAIVYNAPVKIHRSIGLDVTYQVQLGQDEVRQKFQTGLLRPVYDFAQVWFAHKPVLTFHDPLAATTIFDDQICGFERGQVEVELTSNRLQGLTFWQPDQAGQHEVALQVNKERFFEHYFGVFQKN
jgi:purine nucleosidase